MMGKREINAFMLIRKAIRRMTILWVSKNHLTPDDPEWEKINNNPISTRVGRSSCMRS